ncbi:hypothetical protein [Herbaspirillum seropedicae]|uniref:hypothetical protein n=1 Tax=Herbaspirillum seropedicae TaxID=964 RepID=UPI003FCC4AB1
MYEGEGNSGRVEIIFGRTSFAKLLKSFAFHRHPALEADRRQRRALAQCSINNKNHFHLIYNIGLTQPVAVLLRPGPEQQQGPTPAIRQAIACSRRSGSNSTGSSASPPAPY